MTGNYAAHRQNELRRELAKLSAIEWNGQVQAYSETFANQVILSLLMLRPSMPGFPALTDSVEITFGKGTHTIRIGEAEQLLELTQAASQRVQGAMNGINQTKEGAA